jgi:hypothetical protein
MRRSAISLAFACALAVAGCDGGRPKPGGVYVLTDGTLLYGEGPGVGEPVRIEAGSIVRVVSVVPDEVKMDHARIVIEREEVRPGFPSYEGETGYVPMSIFRGAPTEAP